MENSVKCKVMECCRSNRCSAVGIVLIVIASIMTIVTFSGLGIFGMFIVGLAMCCHKRLLCQCGCCNSTNVTDEVPTVCEAASKEPKRTTKKPVA